MINVDQVLFIDKVKHAKIDNKMKNADIAKATGCAVSTIESFLCRGGSELTADKIAKVLHIER